MLGRMSYEDGEGYIGADVELGEPVPLDPVPPSFWMTSLPFSTQAVWHICNTQGRASYLARKARGGHAWQQRALPRAGSARQHSGGTRSRGRIVQS